MTMSSSPAATRSSAFRAHGFTSSQASGAPSEPCRGAPLRSVSVERMTPTARSANRSVRAARPTLVEDTRCFDPAFIARRT